MRFSNEITSRLRSRVRQAIPRIAGRLAGLTLLTGLGLSGLVFWSAESWEERRIHEQFDAAADNRITAFRRELGAEIAALEAIAKLYGEKPARGFEAVRDMALAAHNSSLVEADVQLLPALTPEARQALGESLPGLRRLMDSTVGRGSLTLSAPQRGDRPGSLTALVPVYRRGPTSRGAPLLGFVAARIEPARIMEDGLRYLRPFGVDVVLTDLSEPAAPHTLYYHRSRFSKPVTPAHSWLSPGTEPAFTYSAQLSPGGRHWEILCRSVPQALRPARAFGPWGLLACCLIITILTSASLASYIRHNGRIQALVERRTRQLCDANRQLSIARDQAVESARAKTHFLANISHEIRTPMNGILGMTALTLDTELGSMQREYLESILHSAESLLAIINDLLDFSKMESGTSQLHPIEFDLAHTIEEVARLMAPRAHQKNVELVTEISSRIPALLIGDPIRLRQILVNLLGNAIKFTNQGEVVLKASGEPSGENAFRLRVELRDTGIGIPAEKLQAIFEPFQQADGSITRQFGGTGLGLSISTRLAQLMQGKIEVESTVGQGSTFRFEARLGLAGLESKTEAHGAGLLSGRRVLIVEANAATRQAVATWITEQSGLADAVSSWAEAGCGPNSSLFDFIVFDSTLPGLRSVQPESSSRGRGPAPILIALLRQLELKSEVERCRQLGVEHFVMRPASRSALNMVFGQALRGATPPPAPAELRTPQDRGCRILLAEDNAVNRRLATRLLERAGHDVTAVVNGAEAVSAFEQSHYDLVLMDLQMPVLDGWQATAAIRAAEAGRPQPTPIVALTANAAQGVAEQCLQMGMSSYLSKPFRPNELLAVIQATLRTTELDAAPR